MWDELDIQTWGAEGAGSCRWCWYSIQSGRSGAQFHGEYVGSGGRRVSESGDRCESGEVGMLQTVLGVSEKWAGGEGRGGGGDRMWSWDDGR